MSADSYIGFCYIWAFLDKRVTDHLRIECQKILAGVLDRFFELRDEDGEGYLSD